MYIIVNKQNREMRHSSKILRLTRRRERGVYLRIDQERRAVESAAGRTVRLAALEDLLPVIGERLAAIEPAAGNRWLREMIAAVEVDDRSVIGVRLRWW